MMVNCRTARRLMHELLDGSLTDREALDTHLAECEACRAQMSRLRYVHETVAEAVGRPPDQPDLAQDMSGIWHAVRARRLPPTQPGRPRAWAVAACGLAAGLLFALGLWTGRCLWPREAQVVRVVTETKIVEKRVEVPVIEERVVIERIPVVRTRVVYRDRVVRPASIGQSVHEAAGPAALSAPQKAPELVTRLEAPAQAGPTLVSCEIHPVTVVEEAPPEAEPAEDVSDVDGGVQFALVAWQPSSTERTVEGGSPW